MMHERGKSDSAVRAVKPANKAERSAGAASGANSKTPFVVPYRVSNTVLEILRVYHHAHRWPKQM